MDEIFNPSLLLSLGPSSRKALGHAQRLLSNIPEYFLNLIEIYHIENEANFACDIQNIIDNKLLSARNLNKLVDMGYKVRNENLSSVKINLYLLWDVYEENLPAEKIIKELFSLKYGNIDKNLHTGATLFIIPIIEKEWALNEDYSAKSLGELKNVIDFLSTKEEIMSMDSRLYMLHSVSNDGTRIQRNELEFIAGIIIYQNIIPSKDPPLCHFNRKMLMHEGSYKIGSIGITSLAVFKDLLLEDFSRYMAVDMLKKAIECQSEFNASKYIVFDHVKYEYQKSKCLENVSIRQYEDCCRLEGEEKYSIELPEDIYLYPQYLKNWEVYLENSRMMEIRHVIDNNKCSSEKSVIKQIDTDIERIVSMDSFKDASIYLDRLKGEIKKQRPSGKSNIVTYTEGLFKKLDNFINGYPHIAGLIVRLLVLAVFLIYSMNNLILPFVNQAVRPIIIVVFILIFLFLSYLDYEFRRKKLHELIDRYRDGILKKCGSNINMYAERQVLSINDDLIRYIDKKNDELNECISNINRACNKISPEYKEYEELENLIISIMNFEDRARYYKSQKEEVPINIDSLYLRFIGQMESYLRFRLPDIEEIILEYARDSSRGYIDRDFYEYLHFKYQDKIEEKISEWVDRGIIKSKYLLQYINDDSIEEHSLFITSPKVYTISRDIISSKLNNYEAAVIDGEGIYTNCISILRLCSGIDFNKIAMVRNIRGEINA